MSSVSYETYQQVHQNQQAEIKQFLNVVFQQVDTEKFYQIFAEAMAAKTNGMDVYRVLLDRAPREAQGSLLWQFKAALKSLKEERGTLADNIAKISDPLYTREGYLEINMPFRMGASVRQAMGITGDSAVVNDEERLTDLVQCGFPRPYRIFVPYGEDNPLRKENFPFPISVVGMFAGAHHCRPKNLQPFIQSIYDLLQPGGIFLLRDHDARTDDLKAVADVAHRFFNALTNVSEDDEQAEIRNFQALSYFIQIAQTAGFILASEPLVREGDTTQNALVKFYKPVEDHTKAQIGLIREKLINACRQRPSTKSYIRKEVQTHLTKVEWLNVEQEQAQAQFYQNNPFWAYPHCRDALESASVFIKSFQAARSNESTKNILLSDYTLMNSTITIATGIHNIAKGIIYTPLGWISKLGGLLPHQENSAWQKPAGFYGNAMRKYSDSLEEITSYDHSYLQDLKGFFSTLTASFSEARQQQNLLSLLVDRQTVKNITTGVAMVGDLLWRQLFASTVNMFYGGQDNGDAREIGLIVNPKDNPNPFEGCGDNVKSIIQEEGNPYKGIIALRYRKLTEVLETLSNNGVEIVEIAGQTAMEVEFVVDNDGNPPAIDGMVEINRRHYYPNDQKRLAACMVPVDKLHLVLKIHRSLIHRIYDF